MRLKAAHPEIPGLENEDLFGRQKGVKGHGRKVTLAVTGEQEHRAESCAACGQALAEDAVFEASTGLYVIDLETESGLRVTHIKHIYGGTRCDCGHVTYTQPGRCAPEAGWQVELTEWHLVGPTLLSLIQTGVWAVCLS